jgi:hypothetical protein
MGKTREPQIILKTDQRTIIQELGLGGKFQAKSSGWDENRMFLEGDVLEVVSTAGREATRGAAATDPDRAERYATFVRANPDWPSIPLLRRRAEVRLWQEQRYAISMRRFLGDQRNSSLRLPSAKQEIRASEDKR